MRVIFFLMVCLLLTNWQAKADSPITSTDFHVAYDDLIMVQYAKDAVVLDDQISNFLLNPHNQIDYKMAVINALSWSVNGKSNAVLFQNKLARKYAVPFDRLNLEMLNGDELTCLAYLTVMDDYFNPKKALPLIEAAKRKNPGSFTVAIIGALIEGQIAMDDFSNWCDIWKKTEAVINNPVLVSDFRKEALEIIVSYMSLYKDHC